MKLADFTTIVKANAADAAATVDQEVADAVNELSRFIQMTTHSDENITAAMADIARPSDAVKILRMVLLNEEEEIYEVKRTSLIEVEKNDKLGFWQTQSNIMFTDEVTNHSSVGTGNLRIVYKKAFAIPTVAVDFDGPHFLTEVITTRATEKWYRRFLSEFAQDPASYPGITLHEITEAWEIWNKSSRELLTDIVRVWESMYVSGLHEQKPFIKSD